MLQLRRVHRRLLIVRQVRLQALQVRRGDRRHLPGGLTMPLEAVALESFHAAARAARAHEVHEGVAHVGHGASKHRLASDS